jgi:hypothetical protein
MRHPRAALVIAGLFVATILAMWWMGRLWWCACGEPWLATAQAFSPHTSQHLLDPYSVTHVLHGFVFWWIVLLARRPVRPEWQVVAVIALEAAWEVLENTPWVIQRYRDSTAALGYAGDTIANALADVALCWAGVLLARRLGVRWSLAVFVVVELVLAWWIHDNLTLNVVMLLWPSESLTRWQQGG